MDTPQTEPGRTLPFDAANLDRLMEEAGLDLLLVSSKGNLQYLLGGYRFFFFDYTDAIGISRYLPLLVYQKGRLDHAAYVGNPMESYEVQLGKFWTPAVNAGTWGTVGAIRGAVEHIKRLGTPPKRLGVERAFLPADAEEALRAALPGTEIVDAYLVLERLRAVKTPTELGYLRAASEKVVESMLTVMQGHGPGATKRELFEALRLEEVKRGLVFEYCLLTAGTSLNRAPSDQVWGAGDILTLDSGGNYQGYIGDLCRMAIQGEPDQEFVDLLGEIDEIQQAARKPIRAGARGGDVFASAEEVLRRSANHNLLHFVAHGMGIVSHEAPRLTDKGPVPYPATDADRPLEAGMVLSIETTLPHPRRGFIKLEDTVAVTETGWEAFGDAGRGWNRGGTAVA